MRTDRGRVASIPRLTDITRSIAGEPWVAMVTKATQLINSY